MLSPESSTTSDSDARFTGSMVSQQGYHSLPQPFWTLSSNSLGKFTILFPNLRNQYLGLEGEFTENHLTVETPEAGASAQGAPPQRHLTSAPDHEAAHGTRHPPSSRPLPASSWVRPAADSGYRVPVPVRSGHQASLHRDLGRDLKSPPGTTFV